MNFSEAKDAYSYEPIDLTTIYLKVVHYLMQSVDGMRDVNFYPPTLKVVMDPYRNVKGCRAAGEYRTIFRYIDALRIIAPTKTSICIFPARIQYVIEQNFRLPLGQGFYIAMGITVYTIIHELMHHYDHLIMWKKYCDGILNGADVYQSYNKFIMDDMEGQILEDSVKQCSMDLFKDIWPKVAPWSPKQLTDMMVAYIGYCDSDASGPEVERVIDDLKYFEENYPVRYDFIQR